MRRLWLLCLALTLLLTGCAGDTVIYQVQCDHEDTPQTTPQPTPEVTEEALKTDLTQKRTDCHAAGSFFVGYRIVSCFFSCSAAAELHSRCTPAAWSTAVPAVDPR